MLSIAFRYDARRGSKYQKASILQIAYVCRLINFYVLCSIEKGFFLNRSKSIAKTCVLSWDRILFSFELLGTQLPKPPGNNVSYLVKDNKVV